MTKRRILNCWVSAAVLALALGAPASAQTIAGDRFTLNLGPCTIRSGAGAPEGAVTGKVCDVYIRTDGTGQAIVYVKDAGTGTAGWNGLTPGIPLDPTPGKVLVSGSPVSWSASPSLTAITGAADLTLNPARDLILQGRHEGLFPAGDVITNPGGRKIYPQVGFSTSIGLINSKYLAIHAAELWVETLVAQQTLATIGGRVVVAPTNILARDVAPGATSIAVKYPSFLLHEPGIELGSKLFLESGGKFEAMAIVSNVTPAPEADGSYVYAVTRDMDGTGANQWYAGDAILDAGKATGGAVSGMIDLYATRGILSGAGPSIVGSVRTGPQFNQMAPRFALGNLNGVGYGHASDIYGFAAGDPNGPNLFADPVNGVHLRQGGTAFVSLRPDGSVTIRGEGSGVTNINGGNIQADTITGDKIAANSITVADLNATGFGGNVIKNGTFEANAGKSMGDPSALAGWSKDLSSSATPLQNACCGTTGPGTLLLDSGNGAYMSVVYLATPVEGGQVYRVAGKLYAEVASAVAVHIGVYESDSQAAGVRYVHHTATNPAAPDVPHTGQTFLAINAPVSAGWQNFEYTYVVPQGMRWAGIFLVNESGAVSGSAYTRIYFDDLEMERQIGPGHIRANAITADKIAAGAITADKIAAGAITADKISVGTGGNFLRNSECRTSTSDWTPAWSTPMVLSFNYSPSWALLGESSVCYVEYGGQLTAGHWSQMFSKTFPAVAGLRYESSVYLGMHRAQGRAIIQFLDAGGNSAGFTYGNMCPAVNGGGQYLSGYCRSGVLMDAPGNAVAVRMLVETYYDDGSNHPFTFFVRAFLAEAVKNQTELSAWSPAGLTEITGGLITTGAIQAQHIAAQAITADKIAVRTITADRIAGGAITGTEIAARTIVGGHLQVGTIGAAEIAARAITADRIAVGAITSTEISTGAITSDKINVGSLSAISGTLGTVTAGTITGTTIYGSTMYAGSGNEIHLDSNGLSIAAGNGSGPARIVIGGPYMFGENNRLNVAADALVVYNHLESGDFSTSGNATANNVIGNYLYSNGFVSGDGIVSRNMPTWGGNVRAVYYNYSEQRIGFWTGAAVARSNVQAWTMADPLAILRAPLVTYASGSERAIGFSVEGLAALLPEAVDRDAAGRPDVIRPEAVIAALVQAIAELERRIKVLEAKGGGR